MRILVVNSLYAPQATGGAERVARLFAEGLRDRGHEVAVATTTDEPSHVRTVGDLPVHGIGIRNVYPLAPQTRHSAAAKVAWHLTDSFNILMARELMAVVRQHRPDVVNTHNISGFGPWIWPSLRKAGIPIVHSVHDNYVLCIRSHMYAFDRNCQSQHLWCALNSQPAKRCSRSVTTLVGASQFVIDRQRRHRAFVGVPSAIIGNPYPFATRHTPHRAETARVRLGYLARVEPVKGIEVLLSAVGALRSSNWELVVAGSGPPDYVDGLRARFASEQIRFVGQVDPAEFVPTLDALVVPSLSHDTFGMVIIEAHACGVPVIGARRGGFPELISEGKTGFLFDPDNVTELTTLLESIVAAPQRLTAMAEQCRRAAEQFAPDRIFAQYEDAYTESLTRAR